MNRDIVATLPLSVVIPSLGGKALERTINALNTGPSVPAEILVCLPVTHSKIALKIESKNIKIVKTPKTGQVHQRAFGLERACQPYVMQLDDDVILNSESIRVLLAELTSLGPGNVVSPLGWRYLLSGQYMTVSKSGLRLWLQNIYLYIVCGPPWGDERMGKLSPSGIGFWIDKTKVSAEIYETELLPGGCAVCYREDLVLENYYPFEGKAYCEDLIHSLIWRERGKRLWAVVHADASTNLEPSNQSCDEILAIFKAHLYVVKLMKGSRIGLVVWFLVAFLKEYFKIKLKRLLNAVKLK
jgi:hypothetical protein